MKVLNHNMYLKEQLVVVAEQVVPQPILVLANLSTFRTRWPVQVVVFLDATSARKAFDNTDKNTERET